MAGTAALTWGSGLIGFSPVAFLFLLVVTRRPELLIISILGYVSECARFRDFSTRSPSPTDSPAHPN